MGHARSLLDGGPHERAGRRLLQLAREALGQTDRAQAEASLAEGGR